MRVEFTRKKKNGLFFAQRKTAGLDQRINLNENKNCNDKMLIQKERGICHSYVFKENKVFLTEIYNRPQSTLRGINDVSTYYENGNGVFGLTFQNRLVCSRYKKNI